MNYILDISLKFVHILMAKRLKPFGKFLKKLEPSRKISGDYKENEDGSGQNIALKTGPLIKEKNSRISV